MILIIDNYDSFTYNLFQSISQLTEEVVVKRNDAISVAEVRKLNPDGIIISPGPGRPETAGICIALIQALASEIPILGVCLGMQAIVAAYGGEIIKAQQLMHGKTSMVIHNRSKIYDSVELPFVAGRYHSLVAGSTSLPETLVVEAETIDGIIMGVKHKDHPCYGVQFHPESILTVDGDQILKNFMAICDKELSC